MKKNIVFIWILLTNLVLAESIFAQKKTNKNTKTDKLAGKATDTSLESSVFWEISGKGIKKPSYVFGTHHLFNPKTMIDSKIVQEKFALAERVVGEITIDNMAMVKVFAACMMRDTTMKELLTPKEYAEVEEAFKKVGMPFAMFNRIKPMMAQQMIESVKYAKLFPKTDAEKSANEKQLGMGNPFAGSMDGYFQDKAKTEGKEVGGLESVEDQTKALFDGYPILKQKEMLLKTVRDTVALKDDQEIQKLTQLYKEQNLNKIAEMTLATMETDEYNNLLKNRNDKWMPQIFEMITKKPTFFAVGAAHLVGVDGVILRLRKEGYTVKPIKIVL